MKYFIVFGFLLVLSTSCNKLKLDIPDTGRKIVINGLITTNELLNLRVSKSAYLVDPGHYYIPETKDLDSAEVYIFKNNDRIDLFHKEGEYDFYPWNLLTVGNYYSNTLIPSPGTEYKVVAKFPGLPDASASTVIPNLVKIDKTDTSRVQLEAGSYYDINVGLKFKISFTDPENERNYYLIKMFLSTYFESHFAYANTYSEIVQFKCSDPIVEENIESRTGPEAIAFSDKMINGQKHKIDLIMKEESVLLLPEDYEIFSPPGSYPVYRKTIYLKLYSITEEYFKYIQSLQLYSKNYGNPLAEPVMVNSNVEGGYGMFAGAAIATDSIVYVYRK
jgi:hypothetical protein